MSWQYVRVTELLTPVLGRTCLWMVMILSSVSVCTWEMFYKTVVSLYVLSMYLYVTRKFSMAILSSIPEVQMVVAMLLLGR